MLTVCTAHLGKALKRHRTWRHEARRPSEERINNENFWLERHSDNNTRNEIAWSRKSYQTTKSRDERKWLKGVKIGRKRNGRVEIEALEESKRI